MEGSLNRNLFVVKLELPKILVPRLPEDSSNVNIVAVVSQDRVMFDNLKRNIKNRTLYTCRLFLLT